MAFINNDTAMGAGGYGSGFGGAPMMGGYPGGFGGGGFGGGFGLFGLIGLTGLLGRDGLGGGHGGGHSRGGDCDDSCAREAAILAAIGNAKDATVGEGRGLLAAIASSKDVNVAGFTAIANEICDTKGAVKDALYAQTIQGIQNTEAIKSQSQAFQIANDSKFEALSRQIANDGDVTRALINANTIQDLRDRLLTSERHGDRRELEINIANINTNIQQQQQALFNQRDHDRRDHDISIQNINTNIQQQQQQQQQAAVIEKHHFDRRLDSLFNSFNQVNRNTQDIINLGTMAASGNQANQQTNVK